MRKENLQINTIYTFLEDTKDLKICVLKSNRNNPKNNQKMFKGCSEIGMQQPGIFTEARLALEAGYTLLDVKDGHEVKMDEIDNYLVIIDGNTRFHAWELAVKEGNPFEYCFQYKVYEDAVKMRTAYQKMNVCNTPTSATDYARDIEAVSNNPVLVSYRSKQADGLVPKAAGYATIGREIMKRDLTDIQQGKTPALFNDKPNQEIYEAIYACLRENVKDDPAVFKGSEIWSWNANKINGAEDKPTMAEKLIKMYNNLNYASIRRLQTVKREGNNPKEAVVKNILDELFINIK